MHKLFGIFRRATAHILCRAIAAITFLMVILGCWLFFGFALKNTRIAQRQLQPIVKMLKWMKYGDFHYFDDVCDAMRQSTGNDTNNNSHDVANENDDTEIDSISLEILWQPLNGTKITADVVFIHGLHGMYACRVNATLDLCLAPFHFARFLCARLCVERNRRPISRQTTCTLCARQKNAR